MVTITLFVHRRHHHHHLNRPFKVSLPVAFLFRKSESFLIVTPFMRPKDGKGDTHLQFWLAPLVSWVVLLSGIVL